MAAAKPMRQAASSKASPGETSIDRFIGYNLKRVYMLIQADFRQALGPDGLSTRTFSALALVIDFPGITQSDLARILGIERSGLVAIVDDLQDRGYLRRVPVPGDRRVQALQPTDKGKVDFDGMIARIDAHETAVLSMLSAEERATLHQLLTKIRDTGEHGGERGHDT